MNKYLFTRWHVPPSRTSAEACLVGWPNAQPQGQWTNIKRHVFYADINKTTGSKIKITPDTNFYEAHKTL